MKTLLFLAASIFFVNPAYTQKQFEPGFIVTVKGDTIKGLIKNRNWKVSPKTIQFKANESADEVMYSTTDISAFHLGESNEHFRVLSMVIDKSPIELTKITESSHTLTGEETVFARVVVMGPIVLLHSYDFKDHFYYQRLPEGITELINTLKMTESATSNQSDKKSVIVKNEKYKYQLITLLSDAKQLIPQIQKSEFKEAELKKIFLNYYASNPSMALQVSQTKRRAVFKFGVSGGVVQSNSELSTEMAEMLYVNEKNSTWGPTGGLFFTIKGPRPRAALSLYGDVAYQHHAYSATSHSAYLNVSRTYLTTFSRTNLIVRLGPRYTFQTQGVKPFLNGGFAKAFTVSQKLHTKEDSYIDNIYHSTNEETFSPSPGQTGLWFGAGVSYKKLNLEVRSDRLGGKIKDTEIVSNLRTLIVGLSFVIN